MCQKYVLVEHLNNLNDTIKQPLQLTQRIKFTSFDVSQKFIVFGASSGGIYIYSREPCQFIKLVPTKEGSITTLGISPDENILVLTSSKGLILLLENFITESNTFYKVFSEHEGNVVTALKWHGNEVYCGDNRGKISVTVTANVLTKVLFQTPCLSLMELDSGIVQIDSFSKFLLISTQTRTYLCNTEKQQYRQIGKKLRDGSYGACFLNQNSLNGNKLFSKNSSLASSPDDIKIFCARPGARLWEAKFDASVVYTHQFKNSLIITPTNIVHLDENLESRLNVSDFSTKEVRLQETFNFSQIFIFSNKFIFTFNEDGFYIFDSDSVQLAFWSDYFHNIKDIKLYKHFIYIWTGNELSMVSLTTVENLAIKALIDRQYYVCAELCVHFINDLMSAVDYSDRIHLLSGLKEKLIKCEQIDLLKRVEPLLDAIRKQCNKRTNVQTLKTGIVVLNSHLVDNNVISKCGEKSQSDQNLAETFHALKEISSNMTEKITESTKALKDKVENLGVAVKVLTKDNTSNTNNTASENCDIDSLNAVENANVENERDKYMEIFSEQYEINLVNENAELPQFNEIISKNSYDDLIELLKRFMNSELEHNLDVNRNKWCYQQYLKWFTKNDKLIASLTINSTAFEFLVQSFIQLNYRENLNCTCDFPLPIVKTISIKYYPMGCAILKKMWENSKKEKTLCIKIPYLWKYVLEKLEFSEDILSLLPYLLQFNDEMVLSAFVKKMSYDHWDEATRMLIKLKANACLNCNRAFAKDFSSHIISWSCFGGMMVKSIGGPCAVRLLKRYSKFIPNNSFNQSFYQLSIFATIFDLMQDGLRSQAVELAKGTQDHDVQGSEFSATLEKYLNKKYLQRNAISIPRNGAINVDAKCHACQLPFNPVILEETVRLKCGHIYHKLCRIQKDNRCEVCK